MMKTNGNKTFQNCFALKFLKGFKKGKAHKSIMANPITHATRASNRKPIINADPENALPGGLNFQKIISLEMVIKIIRMITTENIQRKSFGILCKKSMNNYLFTEQI